MTQLRPPGPTTVLAPAKLNLGLEVIGRRTDGYHDLVTILQTISLFDRFEIEPADRLDYQSPAGIRPELDLVRLALHGLTATFGLELQARIRLHKEIPTAAGLGGGSSDAGTLIGTLGTQAGLGIGELERFAATLGSDVPFFVRGGTALASGTGTELRPLPSPTDLWFVLVVPPVDIASKTTSLYRELTPADLSDGRDTLAQGRRIVAGQPLDPDLYHNSFARPLYQREAVKSAAEALIEAGARHVLPSGAGPALFTTCYSSGAATEIARRLDGHARWVKVCTTVGPRLNERGTT